MRVIGPQLGGVVCDMAHWQLSPVERALERPAGGTARGNRHSLYREWHEALLTTNPGCVKPTGASQELINL